MLAGLLTGAAQAHDPPWAEGVHRDGDRWVVTTGRGLLLSEDGVAFRLLCAEALGLGPAEVPHARVVEGRVVVATSRGVLRDDGAGCGWTSAAELDGVTCTSLDDDAGVLVTSTSHAGFPNGVYRSEDGGVSWEPAGTGSTDHFITSLATAPGHPGRLAVAGFRLLGPTEATWVLGWSEDGGQTLRLWDLARGEHDHAVEALGFAGDGVAVAAVHTYASSQLPDPLYVTGDAGTSWERVAEVEGIEGFASVDGLAWIATPWRLLASADLRAWTERASLGAYGLDLLSGYPWAAGAHSSHGFALATSPDGGSTWVTALTFPEVTGPVTCPPDDPVTLQCAGDWEDWVSEVYVVPPAEPWLLDPAVSCGGAGGMWALLLVPCAGWRRRRTGG